MPDQIKSALLSDLAERQADAFEAAWKRRERPRIAEHLSGVPEPEQPDLFAELAHVDAEYRRRAGERPLRQEYLAEFARLLPRHAPPPSLDDLPVPGPDNQLTTMSDDPHPTNDPTEIGPFTILKRIAKSGQADVYRAVHSMSGADVALKLSHLPAVDGAARGAAPSLADEARILCSLDHPNLARVLALDVYQGHPYLALPLFRGQNLEDLIAGRPMAARRAAEIVAGAAHGVAHAHRRGVLHLDLKPANIIVDEDGTPKVIDFGVARACGAWQSWDRPADARLVSGTVLYMPPEQAKPEPARIGPASDVFSLGATLYHCLVGRPPYSGRTMWEALREARACALDRAALNAPAIPRRVRQICLRAMDPDPARRYADAGELATALDAFLRPWWRRRGVLRATLLVAALATSAGVVGGAFEMYRLSHAVAPDVTPDPAAVTGPLQVDVVRDSVLRPVPLSVAAPLYDGDRLTLRATIAPGYYASLVAFNGITQPTILASLNREAADRTLRYPDAARPERNQLLSAEATEAFFVCVRRDAPIAEEDVRAAGLNPGISVPNPLWPVMTDETVWGLGADGKVSPLRAPMGLGAADDPDDMIHQRLEELRRGFAMRFAAFQGVACAHHKKP
jgi:hypothetical protein